MEGRRSGLLPTQYWGEGEFQLPSPFAGEGWVRGKLRRDFRRFVIASTLVDRTNQTDGIGD